MLISNIISNTNRSVQKLIDRQKINYSENNQLIATLQLIALMFNTSSQVLRPRIAYSVSEKVASQNLLVSAVACNH